MFQSNLFTIQGAFAGSATTERFIVPYDCVVRNADAIVNGDPGDAEEIYIVNGADTIATLTFGSGIAAGAKATFAKDATNGNKVLSKGDILEFTTSAAAAATYNVSFELDPTCTVHEE